MGVTGEAGVAATGRAGDDSTAAGCCASAGVVIGVAATAEVVAGGVTATGAGAGATATGCAATATGSGAGTLEGCTCTWAGADWAGALTAAAFGVCVWARTGAGVGDVGATTGAAGA